MHVKRNLPHRILQKPKATGVEFLLLAFMAVCFSGFADDKVNYGDHVAPLIEANCSKCHNPDKKKADLDLTSYAGALKGSGSGPIVVSGNVDGSKLWKSLTHAEEPFMPPNRPKLSDKDLEVFKQWIVGGLLETAGGKVIAVAKPGMDLALKPEEAEKPEGPPPMPQDLPLDTAAHTPRMRAITGLAASPWAPVVAVAGQKQVLLFNTDTLELLGILPFTEGEPVDLKFSRNGKLLLAAGGRGAKSGRVIVWDVVTGDRLMTVGQEYDTVLSADIRPDQSLVALGGPSRLVKLYSTKTGELQHKIKKHTDWVTAVAFSPNGQMLATADRNGGISLWDPDSAQELFTLPGHKSAVTSLSWRPDSKLLASSSEDGTVKLWEVQEGKQVKTWTAHGPGALWVSYSRDGHLVTCGRDNAVVLWDANGGKQRKFEFSGNLPLRAVFNQDASRVVATDFEGRCAAWAVADSKRIDELDPNPLPLAEQISAARKRIAQLQLNAPGQTRSAEAVESQSQTNHAEAALLDARAEVARLERAQTLTIVYRLRATLMDKQRAQESLAQTIEANRQAARQAEKDAAAAKELSAKAQDQLKSSEAEIARGTFTRRRLAAEIKAEQAELNQLQAELHPRNAAPQKLADTTVH